MKNIMIPVGYTADRKKADAIGFVGTPDNALPDFTPTLCHYSGDAPLIVFGKTGAGKGRRLLIPTILDAPADAQIICVDVKGEAAQVTAAHRRKSGDVNIIDPWGVVASESASLNPLVFVADPKTTAVATDNARMVAEAIIPDDALLSRDPFWTNSARNVVQLAMLLLAAHAPDEHKNLGVLADLVGSGTGPTLEKLLAAGLCSPLVNLQTESENLATLAWATLSGVMSTAASFLRPFSSPMVRSSLAATSIDLEGLRDGTPSTTYLVMPPKYLKSHGVVLRLWLDTLVKVVLSRTTAPNTKTLLLIDELPQIGPLESIAQASFLLRGYGVQTALFLQDLHQLKRLFPDDWLAYIRNAGAVLCLSGGAALHDAVEHVVGVRAAVNIPELKAGHAVFIENEMIEVLKTLDYLTDERYAGLAGQNRFYAGAPENGQVTR